MPSRQACGGRWQRQAARARHAVRVPGTPTERSVLGRLLGTSGSSLSMCLRVHLSQRLAGDGLDLLRSDQQPQAPSLSLPPLRNYTHDHKIERKCYLKLLTIHWPLLLKKNSMHLPSLAIISQGLKKEINCWSSCATAAWGKKEVNFLAPKHACIIQGNKTRDSRRYTALNLLPAGTPLAVSDQRET